MKPCFKWDSAYQLVLQDFFHQQYDTPSSLSELHTSRPFLHRFPCHRRHVLIIAHTWPPHPFQESSPLAWSGCPSFICSASFSKSRIQSNTSLDNTRIHWVWSSKKNLDLTFSNLTFSRARDVHGTVGYQGLKVTTLGGCSQHSSKSKYYNSKSLTAFGEASVSTSTIHTATFAEACLDYKLWVEKGKWNHKLPKLICYDVHHHETTWGPTLDPTEIKKNT